MSKNKLMRTIALLLTAITLLPIAHAQTTGGFNWIVLAINAAVIFVALFALQAFLIPQKSDKEKTSVWVIMIIASLLAAFLFGSNVYIWQGPLKAFFNIYILVNSAIIAAVLYFALGLLKIQNLQSTEGKTGYGILIFLFAVMIAVNIAPDKFLWKEEVVKNAFGFLFSAEKGILNPKSGLLVFVTSFVLISFFFKNYLLEQGNEKLNYALALIFAVNLAMPPVNPMKDVIQMGEIMFILIVSKTLKATVPSDKPWAALLLSILLVGWASAALSINTPENRGAVAGMICSTPLINCKAGAGTGVSDGGFFGMSKITLFLILIALAVYWPFGGKDGKKISGWGIGLGLTALILLYMWNSGVGFIGKIGLGLLTILAIIAAILYGIGRNEKRKGKLWNTINKYGVGPIMEWLRKTPITPIKWIASWWTGKDPYEEGTLPKVFKSLRAELMTLMNYQTRIHTYFGKANAVVE
ncbi:hypothetical protein HYT92_02690, partial [Candidatus Pacearchaeota archaeon]|nr:hypothetical protein [Candidatus Pacearchaeota archaeon]